MRKLDLYIAFNFIAPFVIATAFITGLYIVGDAFGKLDDYLEEAGAIGEALSRMVRLYPLRIPAFVAPILPVGMLFGAAYGLAQLSGRNELTAMRACGIGLWRILAPIYVTATMIALLGMANRELLVPKVEAATAGDVARWTGEAKKYKPVTLYLEREETLFTMRYNVERRHARSVSITRQATGEHIRALEARPVAGGWELTDATIGDQAFPRFTLKTSLRRHEVERALVDPALCPIGDLRNLIRADPANRAYRMLYHARLTYPFVGIVLVGLGLPFVIGRERIQRSRLLGVGVCVLICMVFYTVEFIARDLGEAGYLPAALAAWLPTVVFGALGFYLLDTLHS